jgi:hypothetical protein
MTSICRSIAAAVLLLFLTACHGWDRPLYEENPASGSFVLGTWVNEKKRFSEYLKRIRNIMRSY